MSPVKVSWTLKLSATHESGMGMTTIFGASSTSDDVLAGVSLQASYGAVLSYGLL
jgi:hypothetical protein